MDHKVEKILCKDPISGVTVTELLPDLPRGTNLFHYDAKLVGSHIARGWVAMHIGFDQPGEPQPLPFLILVNTRTGKRIRLELPKHW